MSPKSFGTTVSNSIALERRHDDATRMDATYPGWERLDTSSLYLVNPDERRLFCIGKGSEYCLLAELIEVKYRSTCSEAILPDHSDPQEYAPCTMKSSSSDSKVLKNRIWTRWREQHKRLVVIGVQGCLCFAVVACILVFAVDQGQATSCSFFGDVVSDDPFHEKELNAFTLVLCCITCVVRL